ncbi:hypothetical protein F511_31815 [Dorcoceras hygrometricum]|uniref:Uncharacterized protein n=1 Tax=Dorcoceras hygrometricum TaxID=472368 RepID=A0A2Z7D2W9_9LAMI|nr:hypothetical protein F511_31815 [Dorcoceras hygrometricum]
MFAFTLLSPKQLSVEDSIQHNEAVQLKTVPLRSARDLRLAQRIQLSLRFPKQSDGFWHGRKLLVKLIGTSPIMARGGGRPTADGGAREEANGVSTCVTLNGSGIQLALSPQPFRLRNHNFGFAHRIMVKRLATSPHDPLGITDSACKNQLVVVSVQYGPFNTYIPIRSKTIGKSRVAKDPITMHTS